MVHIVLRFIPLGSVVCTTSAQGSSVGFRPLANLLIAVNALEGAASTATGPVQLHPVRPGLRAQGAAAMGTS